MKNPSIKNVQIILDFLETKRDFTEMISLKSLPRESSRRYRVFKVRYLDKSDELSTLRIELDLKKEKISSGSWGDKALQTIKIKSFSTHRIDCAPND